MILEVKNWKGTIIFEPDFHQLMRIHNEKEEAFHDPISQAKHQSRQLKEWLAANGFPDIPIESAVIISSPSTIIKSPSKQTSSKVLHAHRLLSKLTSIEKSYSIVRLNKKQIKKISHTLLKKHVEHEMDLMKFLKINPDTSLTVVHCPQCGSLPMIYHWGQWRCPVCKTTSDTAHHQAFYLNKPSITNAESRKFTHLTSVFSASRLLGQMNLQHGGEKKNRYYKTLIGDL